MRLQRQFVTNPFGCEAFSSRFSPDDKFLAASYAHGQVCVYNVSTGQEAFRLNRGGHHPVKQVCWRPEAADAPLRTRSVLVGVGTDGLLRQWYVMSAKLMYERGPDPPPREDEVEADGVDVASVDVEEQFFSVDYSADGAHIVAGGLQDLCVFDEETKKQVVRLRGGDTLTTKGHSNRVLAVRCHPSPGEANIVLSGGWDNTVQFWDLRVGHAVRMIFGPHICGDALDISADGKTVLTGSWRAKDAIELWDLGSGTRVETLPWRSPSSLQDPPCLLYTARFSPGTAATGASQQLIVVGGSCGGAATGTGEAKLLRRYPDDHGAAGHCLGTFVRFTCLSADFSGADAGLIAMAGGDGRIRVLHLDPGPE